ncbi:MAG: DUF1214 domain-containing protein [Acidimicrobiia bacterium]|nr:DUF1214 domain-containing protein [Acidimicrobiia bacterium]
MNNDSLTSRAWEDFAQSLDRLGKELASEPFPVGTRETAEGYRYLARLTTFGLQWALEFSDPDFPSFYRYDDDVTKWGGPNVDNRYLRATIRGTDAYRITGNGTNTHGFLFSLHQGDMQLGEFGVYGEIWHDQLVTDEDGNFELILSPTNTTNAANWMALDPSARIVSIREYFNDWSVEKPGDYRIEKIGNEGLAKPSLTDSEIAQNIQVAKIWIESSLRFWNGYVTNARNSAEVNTIAAASSALGGATDIAYGSGFCSIGDDEAFVIEGEAPDAWTWNFLLYNGGWFESLDIATRPCSRNGTQLTIDPDGRFRIVVSHSDPGVANWLDTSGLRDTLVTYRFIRTTTSPVPSGRVVKLTDLAEALHPGTKPFSPEQRRAEIVIRQHHIASRFRR